MTLAAKQYGSEYALKATLTPDGTTWTDLKHEDGTLVFLPADTVFVASLDIVARVETSGTGADGTNVRAKRVLLYGMRDDDAVTVAFAAEDTSADTDFQGLAGGYLDADGASSDTLTVGPVLAAQGPIALRAIADVITGPPDLYGFKLQAQCPNPEAGDITAARIACALRLTKT